MADNNDSSKRNGTDEGEDEVNTVTMVDVLKAEEFLEENADAVLGPGDDKNCTYSEGYLKRQALYSCLTCLPEEGVERAGVCLACSYHCHGDHDLVELYTKRNFRCDCGNSLFKGKACLLDPVKSGTNENNSYNKNFQRLYCSCNRPYPDPEESEEDSMIQCVICEDWFHTRHLGSNVPKDDDYAEMICGSCTDKLTFLQYYLGYSVSKVSKIDEADANNESAVNVSVSSDTNTLNSSQVSTSNNSPGIRNPQSEETATPSKVPELKVTEDGTEKENKVPLISADSTVHIPENKAAEEVKNESSESNKIPETKQNENSTTSSPAKEMDKAKDKDCIVKSLIMLPRGSGATFWPEGFRKLLCTCVSCLEMYKRLDVPFLTDEEDTVQAYEEKGKIQKTMAGPTQYEMGMEALSSLDRVQQMEAILSYNEMKTHLSEYLAKFVENKKVVREEDIREFFTGMQARKRQKFDIPYNCR